MAVKALERRKFGVCVRFQCRYLPYVSYFAKNFLANETQHSLPIQPWSTAIILSGVYAESSGRARCWPGVG